MKRLTLTLTLALALAPALALAAPQQGNAPAGGPGARSDDPAAQERAMKRLRVARTVGLAEALDLDDAGALKLRDTLAQFDQRRAPLRQQLRDGGRILRDAARGDTAAAGQVDSALQRMRDARVQLQQIHGEMLAQVTQGMAAEKKARAALFLSRFHERAPHMMRGGPGGPGGMHHGPGGPMRGMRGGGPGPGMGPDRLAFGPGDDLPDPSLDDDGPLMEE
ncbi:MAG TPA: periplasmic heavy metal sensor [Anaeromyxobacteraceae bacterium]|nr:periplasmic heavy metal sensor [Anaeromyxobacteraceae bacterium]